MNGETASEMKNKRYKPSWFFLLGLPIVLVLVGMFAPLISPLFVSERSSMFEQFLCRNCGQERKSIIKKKEGVIISESSKISSTPISQCIWPESTKKCKHDWTRVYHDFHGSRESGHGGVGSRFFLYSIMETTEIPECIVKFAVGNGKEPQEVWRTILDYVVNSRIGQHSLIGDWENNRCLDDSPEYKENQFDLWLQKHYSELKKSNANKKNRQ
jgi:hypothetical protein